MNPPSSWSFFSLQPFVLRRGRGGRRNGAALVSGRRSGLRRRAARRGPALAGPGDRGPRRYAPTAQIPEGQLEPVVFHDLPGAADDHVVPLAGRRDQPDLAVRGTFDRIGGKSRLRVVEPGGRLLFVADDEPERVGPLARRLELRAHLLAAAAQDRDQATDVDLPAVGRAHPQQGRDGQDDQGDDADDHPQVPGQEARRLGHGDVHHHVAVDEARVGGVDSLDLEPGGAGGRVLIDGDRERDAGRLPDLAVIGPDGLVMTPVPWLEVSSRRTLRVALVWLTKLTCPAMPWPTCTLFTTGSCTLTVNPATAVPT